MKKKICFSPLQVLKQGWRKNDPPNLFLDHAETAMLSHDYMIFEELLRPNISNVNCITQLCIDV